MAVGKGTTYWLSLLAVRSAQSLKKVGLPGLIASVLPLKDDVGLNGLPLSPVGLIPQRDRRDRIVIDYTWSGVNEAIRCLVPDSML